MALRSGEKLNELNGLNKLIGRAENEGVLRLKAETRRLLISAAGTNRSMAQPQKPQQEDSWLVGIGGLLAALRGRHHLSADTVYRIAG